MMPLDVAGLQFLGVISEPLENPWNRLVKRLLDITFSSLALVTAFPVLCLITWIMQHRQSPGPLFYRQSRSGLHNEEFEILKFRTMNLNTDAARQATQGDSRIYPFGAVLRRYSLDEVPQLLNVFMLTQYLVVVIKINLYNPKYLIKIRTTFPLYILLYFFTTKYTHFIYFSFFQTLCTSYSMAFFSL